MAIYTTVITATSTPVSIFTSNGSSALTTLYLCNKTANTVIANVYLVSSAGEPAEWGNTQIYSELRIAAKDTYILDTERILLDNGDSIYANVNSGFSITATTSYTGI
jgi:hypothetical protein